MPTIVMGKNTQNFSRIPCGNIAAISGFDAIIKKTATITDHPKAWPIKNM